jgi:hypothetical protein
MSFKNYGIAVSHMKNESVLHAGEGVIGYFTGKGRKARAEACQEELNAVLEKHEKKPKKGKAK